MSAAQDAASVWAVQASAGGVAQSQGAQAAPAGQAGQTQVRGGSVDPDEPALPLAAGLEPPPAAIVVVIVVIGQAQRHAGQVAPAGHSGQLQVQVPLEPPESQAPDAPPDDPPAPVDPPVPPAPVPQSHLQGGQA